MSDKDTCSCILALEERDRKGVPGSAARGAGRRTSAATAFPACAPRRGAGRRARRRCIRMLDRSGREELDDCRPEGRVSVHRVVIAPAQVQYLGLGG